MERDDRPDAHSFFRPWSKTLDLIRKKTYRYAPNLLPYNRYHALVTSLLLFSLLGFGAESTSEIVRVVLM